MDAQTKLQGVGKYPYYLFKYTLQIVVSVAFLSIFLCHSSIFAYSLFPHSFHVYFSTYLFSLFTRTLERKYMFLIFNGILAFIAKTNVSPISANLTETKGSVTDDVDGGDYDIDLHVSVVSPISTSSANLTETRASDYNIDHNAPLEVELEDSYRNEVEEHGEYENGSLGEEDDEDEEEESEASVIVEQEQQEEGPVSISTEELNRKIEEFIRKMKEEIRIEAQQQQQQMVNAL